MIFIKCLFIKNKYLEALFCMAMITIICISANALRGRFWNDSTSSDKKLYYIKDGPFPEKLGWQTSLQCIDERTGEREIISEDPGDSFLGIVQQTATE